LVVFVAVRCKYTQELYTHLHTVNYIQSFWIILSTTSGTSTTHKFVKIGVYSSSVLVNTRTLSTIVR
jgi:hypothetical protein